MRKAAGLIASLVTMCSAAFADPCAYDQAAMMSQSYEAFDKTLDGGWRVIGDVPGCEAAAADLIKAYRMLITERPEALRSAIGGGRRADGARD